MRRFAEVVAAIALAPLAGVRQLIKDLHYRNDAERDLARLDVVERQLEIAARYGLLDDPAVRAECRRRLLGDAVAEPLQLSPAER